MTDSVRLVATIAANDASKERVREAMRTLVPLSQAEPGCLRYDFFEIDPDGYGPLKSAGGTFAVLEEWTDSASLEAHLISEHFLAFADAFSPEDLAVTVQNLQTA